MKTCYFEGPELREKIPTKIQKEVTSYGFLFENDQIEAIYGSLGLGFTIDCLICTSTELCYYNPSERGRLSGRRFAYREISTVSIQWKFSRMDLILELKGREGVSLRLMTELYDNGPEKLVQFIQNKIRQDNAPQKDSADEIKKYYELKEQGIITEEEFRRKKNSILGL